MAGIFRFMRQFLLKKAFPGIYDAKSRIFSRCGVYVKNRDTAQ